MSHSVLDPGDNRALKYIVTHVFFPLQLPDGDDHTIQNDHSLSRAVATAALLYDDHIGQANIPLWHRISRMLENLRGTIQSEGLDRLQTFSKFSSMGDGDILAFLIRGQNAGVLFRKQRDVTIFESFEISPMANGVMTTQGKPICSYPGPAINIPNDIFNDKDFLYELANFLVRMNDDDLHAAWQSSFFKDTAHPRYITELLTGILRSLGPAADIPRISKRVGDDVVRNNSKLRPWRRSSLWLLIRVALQTTLDHSPLGHHTYKEFILFFMCCLAREQTYADLPSDLLHFMSAKISRRLQKLGSSAPDWLTRTVLVTCTSLRSTIETRWRQVQAVQCASPPWTPSQLDLTRDIQLSLESSGDYLRNSLVNHRMKTTGTPFNPKHPPRGDIHDFLSADSAFFEEVYRIDPCVALYDVERSVEQGIDAWVDGVTDNNEACVKLEVLASKYSSSASKMYANNPELLSVMLLTTIELWIALDKIVMKEIPFLSDYSPEIPISLLENLLLCKTASIQRLRHAHQYLSRRHSQSRSQWSVFSSTTTRDTFAVRFYRKSLHLQGLKTRIEEVARHQVREKVAELERKNARFAELEKAGRAYTMDMQIDVHEWPLPANQLQAEALVFELDCPISFDMWRTATFHFLVDICSPPVQPYGRRSHLNRYQPLQPYIVKHPRSRITPGFNTPPSVFSHPKASIPAKQNEVCVRNKLTFFTFDAQSGILVSKALGRSDSRSYCTYKLQTGRYQSIQKYVDSTLHTSNEVIANQADCHEDLPVHEYIAFGHLRSGGSIQWLNILRELRGRSLSFRCPEVHMLLIQAVSQVGPLADTELVWHQEVQQPTFCYALLGELRNLVQDVEANWMEGVTMDTVSFLLRRILASSPDDAVSLEVLGLLRAVRGKVFTWILELLAELTKTPGDDGIRGVLRDTAVICRGTFDIDPAKIPELLQSAEDIEFVLSCAIIIHDHTPSNVFPLSTYSQLLLERDRHLSLVLESVVCEVVQADRSGQGINLAVRRIWPDYHPGSAWKLIPNSGWFSCTTAPPADQSPQVVHFNILDGSLVVDGKPLGNWLPKEFVQHPIYRLIFGEQMLEVLPGDVPGTDYTTRGTVSNHQVYFSLINDNSDLVIRAKRKQMDNVDSEIIELIPHKKLEDDLPVVLVEGYAHWLNLSTSVMEIRPLNSLWVTSSENWRIDCTPGHYRMWRSHEHLVDVRSQSWDMVSSLLKPLCAPQNLIVSVSPANTNRPSSSLQLSVFLPRYDLSFYVDEDGDLQSRNMQGMVYDENQSIGTLFGLVNKLVLRPKIGDTNAVDFIFRCVVIPDGEVSFRMDGHHVRVEIADGLSGRVRATHQIYRVNTDMGCLAGSASLTSKLYCAYLHALTSGCSVDPLTGRSGTEEALSVLRSASCWSTVRFGSRDAELLCLIASICPSLTWCSEYLIQKVEWRNLPVHSQRPELYTLSKAVKEHYERVLVFHESQTNQDLFHSFPFQDDHLLKRSARRASNQFPFEFSGKPYGENCDFWYSGRDVPGIGSGEHRAHTAATYVYDRTATSTHDVWGMVQSWKKKVFGVSGNASFSLQYHKSWLSPDLPLIWLKAYNLLRKSDERKWFQLLFSLPAMAYASEDLTELVPLFVAFASHPQFRLEDPPQYDSYRISDGWQPSRDILRNYAVDCAYPQRGVYNSGRRSDANAITEELMTAWPCETFTQSSLDPDLYDVVDFTFKVQHHFSSRFRNFKLKEHVRRVEMILNKLHSEALPSPNTPLHSSYHFHPSQNPPYSIPWLLVLDQLFTRPAPVLQPYNRLPRYTANVGNTPPPISTPMHQLIAKVRANAVNPFQRNYTSALHDSVECLGSEMPSVAHGPLALPTAVTLADHYVQCRANCIEVLRLIQRHLGPSSQSEQAVEQSGQWPRITAYTLFRCLASNSPIALPGDWKICLVSFILLALEVQRARRLLLLHFDGLHEELWRELQNEGCDGWDAEVHTDWLLIQLQCNFLVRRVQAEVANEMISPCSGGNTTMQLNMGEGKTSVIVPIVAAVLADGDQLVRVIVPKPLTAQTIHLLSDRLGDLTNRRIYYLPFTRSLEVDHEKVASLHQIMRECMLERGVLILQPEHVLSLKLVSVEKQLSRTKDDQLANQLLEFQRWLRRNSRDILDESDEVLDVRSQLVFTIGLKQHVDGSPERWTTTQQVLGLVSKHAFSLRELFPLGVEYEPGPPGSFPHLRILQADAAERLISWTVRDVMEGLLPNINFGQLHLRSDLADAIRSFISCKDVPSAKVQRVKEYCRNTPLWGGLLLLHGLLANGILVFVFRERRWRVDYGLSPMRTMLAVPYRAKDVPAQKAEFGHPDVAITLTCLSYYYGGLSEEQLKFSFEILLKQHDPSLDYNLWVRDRPAVPESLRTFSAVNIESVEQWKKFLFPLFSRNRATVDFYLSRVVFPKEANEFPSKISSSGWDLAEKKKRLLTGFSGTNDGQYILPLHITQRDPDHQRGTNAKVLSYLLQPENQYYMYMAHGNGERRTSREFLQVLVAQKPKIRVLLDVGAQMLDLENHELAKAWLDIDPNASAAIYFNEDDELVVRTRDGNTELLRSSPFEQQLDRCVVYLDDAHTRGTDIKFPSGFRAAVTLGPRVTKDRLVQGCMRMRKLGYGHSIMFFAPLEVDRRIRSVAGKDPSDYIDTMDILHWAIQVTWESIQWWTPHWIQQGIDHTSRYAAWSSFCSGRLTSEQLSDRWLQPEFKSLEELYEPRNASNATILNNPDISQRCTDLVIRSYALSILALDKEQERELVYEVGRERQVERPPAVRPAAHSIHPDVVNFVKTGVVPTSFFFKSRSKAFIPAFDTLHTTSAITNEAYVWSQSVLVTKDFVETVEASGKMDDYMRPVHWIVSAKRDFNDLLVVLSPYEANCLLPVIRSSTKVHLHLYTPCITKSTKPCDDLSLYSIPAVPDGWIPPSVFMDQLSVFAGQLYLKDYESYIRLCRFLGLYTRDLQDEQGVVVEPDGFILPKNRHKSSQIQLPYTFQSTPTVALRALINVRSKGIDCASTHMGKLVRGQLLSESDFDG